MSVAALFVTKVLMNLQRMGLTHQSCNSECVAFLALVDVIELIMASGRTFVPPQKLLTSVERFLHLFKEAWGCEWMVPKFHWLLHFHDHLRRSRFNQLLSCFCLERKHRVAKRYASELTNTSKKNSKSLLKEVTSHHLGQLVQPDAFAFDVGLVKGSKASKKVKQLLTAELGLDEHEAASIKCGIESRFSPLATCLRGDVVLFKVGNSFKAGTVQLHCEVQGLPITMLEAHALHHLESDCGCSIWRPSDGIPFVIETNEIIGTATYCILPDSKMQVLLPIELR